MIDVSKPALVTRRLGWEIDNGKPTLPTVLGERGGCYKLSANCLWIVRNILLTCTWSSRGVEVFEYTNVYSLKCSVFNLLPLNRHLAVQILKTFGIPDVSWGGIVN